MPSATRSPRTVRRRLELRPLPPFRLDLTAWALRRRAQYTIDVWDGHAYRRTLLIDGVPVLATITQTGRQETPRLKVTLEGRGLAAGGDAHARAILTRMLGLEIDLSGFYARAAADQALAPLAARYRGVKPPRFPTVFECLLNAVANQQLSLEAGLTVLGRLSTAATPDIEGVHPFPAPRDVLRLSVPALRQLGFSERKARAILQLAHAAADGEFDLDRFEPLDDGDVVRALVRHSGIGRWSADYVLLRGLGRLHIFPQGDVGALRGLRGFLSASGLDDDPAAALDRWRPDAGVLYFHVLLRGLEQRGALEYSHA